MVNKRNKTNDKASTQTNSTTSALHTATTNSGTATRGSRSAGNRVTRSFRQFGSWISKRARRLRPRRSDRTQPRAEPGCLACLRWRRRTPAAAAPESQGESEALDQHRLNSSLKVSNYCAREWCMCKQNYDGAWAVQTTDEPVGDIKSLIEPDITSLIEPDITSLIEPDNANRRL